MQFCWRWMPFVACFAMAAATLQGGVGMGAE
jgi:hypothetical protein